MLDALPPRARARRGRDRARATDRRCRLSSPRVHPEGSAPAAEPARRRRQDNGVVIDKAELRSMSRAERHELAVLLAELDEPVGTIEPAHAGELAGTDEPVAWASQHEPVRLNPFRIDPVLARERRLALLISAACSIVLAGWIVVLAATLPHQFD